jgi:hypothetical protein
MVHHKNLMVLGVVAFILIFSLTSVQANPPSKPGNPGLPGCLDKVNDLEEMVASQNVTILRLKAQVNSLQALLESLKNYAPVARTGQKDYERPGDDGDLQKGVVWPVPRFTDNNNGTVTDNLTRLVWLKDAGCFGTGSWPEALIYANNLQTGNCNLSDGSLVGDWRLPNRNELLSLVDINYENPYDPNWQYHGALPKGHPFINILPSQTYWTSSTSSYNFAATAWSIFMSADGSISQDYKATTQNAIWAVRDSK